MKEESKFYVPSIEEFHVGFEYECKIIGHNGVHWGKGIADVEFLLTSFPLLVDGLDLIFRVKHLDREDIESLGFDASNLVLSEDVYFKRADDIVHLVKGCGSTIVINSNWGTSTTRKGKFYIGLRGNTGELTEDLKTERCLFHGTIKNKSELKRILKQIGI